MKERHFALMDRIQRACVFLAGAALVVITVIIPWGVFARYVFDSASSRPEPLAILLMIWLSFLSAVICDRKHRHIAAGWIPNLPGEGPRLVLAMLIELCMLVTNLLLFWYGIRLIETTWHRTIAEFPIVSVGVSYPPVPPGGFLTALFGVERFLKLEFFPPPPEGDALDAISTE